MQLLFGLYKSLYICPIVFIVGILSCIAGIGGGGILIPVYYILGDMNLDQAVALSTLTIMGNTFIRMIIYTKQIDLVRYDKLLAIIPFDAALSIYGYMLNQILPSWLILIFMIIVLLIVFIRTILKTLDLRQQEYQDSQISPNSSNTSNTQTNQDGDSSWILFSLLCLLILIIIQASINNIITQCSLTYWIFNTCWTSLMILLGTLFLWYYNTIITDWKLSLVATNTGWLSTLLGIGGGMLINPLLLHHGIMPTQVSATSSVTTFFSSVASSSQYIISDTTQLPIGDIILVICMGIASSIVGLQIQIGAQSNITIILSILIGTSTLLLTIFAIIELVTKQQSIGFGKFC